MIHTIRRRFSKSGSRNDCIRWEHHVCGWKTHHSDMIRDFNGLGKLQQGQVVVLREEVELRVQVDLGNAAELAILRDWIQRVGSQHYVVNGGFINGAVCATKVF